MGPKWVLHMCLGIAIVPLRPSAGDVVYFKKGYFIEARVVDRGKNWLLLPLESARIRLPRPKEVPKDQVARVVFEEEFRRLYNAKLAALKPDDRAGRQALLQWCDEEHMTALASPTAQGMLQSLQKQLGKNATAQSCCDAGKWAAGAPQKYYLPRDQAKQFYEAALRADPACRPAHLALKHRELDGEWLSEEEHKERTRTSAKPPPRKRRKKKDKRGAPLWQIALFDIAAFGKATPDDVLKTWGEPTRRDDESFQAGGGAIRYVHLRYEKPPFWSDFGFRDDTLYRVRVSCRQPDSPDEDRYFLNGMPLSGKERKRTLRRLAAHRRPIFGITVEEAHIILPGPDTEQASESSTSRFRTTWWHQSDGDLRTTYEFRNGQLYEITRYVNR